jgi:chromosome partitioning protein
MTIYAVVNTKGGVGKTTAAVHLAAMLANVGTTLLIDGDPQASAATWAAWRKSGGYLQGPVTKCLTGTDILTEGKPLAAGFVHTVVDAGGRDSAGLRAALILADVAIVPVGASNLDAAAMSDLMAIIDQARQHNPELSVRVLLSRIDPRTKDTGEMLEFLTDEHMSVLSGRISERVAYRRAVGDGSIVHEMTKGRDAQACAEIDAFFKEVTE